MSDCAINIRFLYWHFKIKFSGSFEISFNKAHYPIPRPKWYRIIEVYEWEPSRIRPDTESEKP